METPTPSERDAPRCPAPALDRRDRPPTTSPPSTRHCDGRTRTSLSLAQLTRGATAAKQRLPVARLRRRGRHDILSQQWYDPPCPHLPAAADAVLLPASKSPEEEVLLQMVLEQCTAAEEHAIPCPPESNPGFSSSRRSSARRDGGGRLARARRGAEKTSTRLLRDDGVHRLAFGHATVQLMDEVDDTACAAGADTLVRCCAWLRRRRHGARRARALRDQAAERRVVRDRCGGGARGARAAEYANSLWCSPRRASRRS